MNRKSTGFDLLAPVYDRLAGWVFGSAIPDSYSHWFHRIPSKSRILIMGGGTGKILQYFPRIPLEIIFLDNSEGMIHMARQQVIPSSDIRVKFICGTINDLEGHSFDIIILPYFLDLFDQKGAEGVMKDLCRRATPGCMWLYSDFVITKKSSEWQKFLLWLMYRFFRLVCGVEASALPDSIALRSANKLVVREKMSYFRGMITSEVWVSSTHPSYRTSD